jgi:hypothetical protein
MMSLRGLMPPSGQQLKRHRDQPPPFEHPVHNLKSSRRTMLALRRRRVSRALEVIF